MRPRREMKEIAMLNRILLMALLTIAPVTIAAAQTARMKNYYNQENKVGFKYPASWAAPGKGKWTLGREENQIGGITKEDGFTVLVDLKPASERWVAGGVTEAEVSLKVATIDEATCKDVKKIDPNVDKTLSEKIGARTFYYIVSDDSAMGRTGTTHFYRTIQDGKCYELAFLRYGAINRKKEPGEKVLDRQYTAILHSLYFGFTVSADQIEIVTYKGRLEVGKAESTIIYLGSETGDLAAFCFTNKSAVGRAILSKCKTGKQCEFTGQVDWDKSCNIKQFYPAGTDMQVLSASGKIISVKSVRRR
jgi:hypothetical protein